MAAVVRSCVWGSAPFTMPESAVQDQSSYSLGGKHLTQYAMSVASVRRSIPTVAVSRASGDCIAEPYPYSVSVSSVSKNIRVVEVTQLQAVEVDSVHVRARNLHESSMVEQTRHQASQTTNGSMASLQNKLRLCAKVDAQSAVSPTKVLDIVGETYTLIMITKLGKFAEFSVRTATSGSETSRTTPNYCKPPSTTYARQSPLVSSHGRTL